MLAGLAAMSLSAAGCQQTQGPNGSFGAAPITQLHGQAPMTGPAMPSLGPFGGSKRVPPPPTGAYGNAAAINATQAGYAPNGITQMSHTDAAGGAGGVANAGWVETNTNGAFQAAQSSFQGNASSGGTFPSDSGTGASIRSGGMPVIDLTGAPLPPGYSPQIPYAPNQNPYPPNQYGSPNYGSPVAARDSNLPGQYPATQLGASSGWNMNSPPSHATPPVAPPNYDSNPYASSSADFNSPQSGRLMFGTNVNSDAGAYGSPSNRAPTSDGAPAANQPAFSTADRPLQWQSPVR